MIVDKKTLNKWRRLQQKGDWVEISERAAKNDVNIRPDNLSKAVSAGEMTEEVFNEIATFYNEREQRIKALA